jgi:hypothetical protein
MDFKNAIQNAARRNRRREQGRCVRCGRKAERIEQHHVAGRHHDPDFTLPLCGSCHDAITEELRLRGVDMRETHTPAERASRAMEATSVFLANMAQYLRGGRK